jgi:hypothetical protein
MDGYGAGTLIISFFLDCIVAIGAKQVRDPNNGHRLKDRHPAGAIRTWDWKTWETQMMCCHLHHHSEASNTSHDNRHPPPTPSSIMSPKSIPTFLVD